MKHTIHPQYYEKAKVTCSCGNTFTVGSTKPEITIEICSRCHPFFTGQEKLIDTAGKVEKFKARRARAAEGSANRQAHIANRTKRVTKK